MKHRAPASAALTTTRRDFLKTASLGLGAAALAMPGLASRPASARPRNPDDQLGVALVGLGNYATNQLAPALQHTTLCRLAGIVTGTPAKAEAWTEKYALPLENVYNYQTFDRFVPIATWC